MSRSDSDIGVGAPPPLPADILQQAVDAAGLPDYDADIDEAANYVDPSLLAAMNLGCIQIPTSVGVAAAAPPVQAPTRTVTARTLPTRVGTATTTTRTTVGRKRPRRRLSRRLHRQVTRARPQSPQRPPPRAPPQRATRSHTPQRRMRMGSSADSGTESERGRPVRMNQAQMQRQLEMLLQDQQQTSRGRRIAGITTTNTITTTYKDGGRPGVRRTSTRVSG